MDTKLMMKNQIHTQEMEDYIDLDHRKQLGLIVYCQVIGGILEHEISINHPGKAYSEQREERTDCYSWHNFKDNQNGINHIIL